MYQTKERRNDMKKRRYYVTLLNEKELKKLRGKKHMENIKRVPLWNQFKINPEITVIYDLYGNSIDKYCPDMYLIRKGLRDFIYMSFCASSILKMKVKPHKIDRNKFILNLKEKSI